MPAKPDPKAAKTIHALILGLGFESGEERRSDRLDFRDVHLASLRAALEAAYAAGKADAARPTRRSRADAPRR